MKMWQKAERLRNTKIYAKRPNHVQTCKAWESIKFVGFHYLL